MSLYYEPLEDHHCALIEPHIRKADRVEIAVGSGMSVRDSLRWGQHAGPAWAVCETLGGSPWPEVLGVGGYTNMGAIWSYWRDLTSVQAREVMAWTPDWMRMLRDHAGIRPLRNFVWERNRAALLWLRNSHCFTMEEKMDRRLDIAGLMFVPFSLKSAEELQLV